MIYINIFIIKIFYTKSFLWIFYYSHYNSQKQLSFFLPFYSLFINNNQYFIYNSLSFQKMIIHIVFHRKIKIKKTITKNKINDYKKISVNKFQK